MSKQHNYYLIWELAGAKWADCWCNAPTLGFGYQSGGGYGHVEGWGGGSLLYYYFRA